MVTRVLQLSGSPPAVWPVNNGQPAQAPAQLSQHNGAAEHTAERQKDLSRQTEAQSKTS